MTGSPIEKKQQKVLKQYRNDRYSTMVRAFKQHPPDTSKRENMEYKNGGQFDIEDNDKASRSLLGNRFSWLFISDSILSLHSFS